VRRFADAGFAVNVLMAPLLPGLTDTDESIDATVAAIAAAGAAGVTPLVLHLRPGAREWYQGWLGRTHPELVDRYRSSVRPGLLRAQGLPAGAHRPGRDRRPPARDRPLAGR
jgi:DNA repair photolyase